MAVTGVVLAAGAAQRMGTQKLLLSHADGTILESTVGAMVASRVDHVVVVVGPNGWAMEQALTEVDATVVRNPDPSRGNMSSLLVAIELERDPDAFILIAGDLPTMDTTRIDALADLWNRDEPWAAVTEYQDRIAHPFLLSQLAIDEIRDTPGEKVLWRTLIDSGDPRVMRVDAPTNAPLDVNTPADYQRLRRQ